MPFFATPLPETYLSVTRRVARSAIGSLFTLTTLPKEKTVVSFSGESGQSLIWNSRMNGKKFRQFNTLSTGVSLWDIQGDTAVVSDRYGTSFYRLLNEIAKYCTNKEAAIVDFCLEEELVVAFTGIEYLDWMINNCHDLTITSPDGKNVRVIEKEEFNRLILREKQYNDRSDNTD